VADSKSDSKPDANPGVPISENDKTLSDGAFGQLPLEERVRSGHASFLPQTILAKRFRVIRFIARGGMGEVYEAEDMELHERVAVKCIRFEYAQEERATDRFRREIQLARRVTHPNVCRTYDVFRHGENDPADGGGQAILIVSMELLSGKTLSQVLHEKGKFAPSEALPIIEQMAAGLGAAHKAGVVHRDFKSANVLLVPAEHADGVRAVITDFGLARETAPEAAKLTGTLDVVGTPAYMAPEQLNGGEISAATDIYALGIVMYEMLTGVVPYSGDSAMGMALRRLFEPAPSPSASAPGLDSKWEATVLHCLEREPKDRFSDTEEIVRTLKGEVDAPARNRRKVSPRTWQLWIAASLLAGLLAGGFWYSYQRGKGQTSATKNIPAAMGTKQRPSVAVLGFQNLTETANAGLLGDMLTDGLWSQLDTDEIRFIAPSQVDDMKRNLGIKEVASSLDSKQLARIQEYLGSDVIITGSYRVTPDDKGKKIDWNIHLLGKAEGATGVSLQTSGTETDLNDMVARAGKLIRSNLGVELTINEESRLDNSLSTNTEALRYFSEARERRRSFDIAGGIKALQKAVSADPDFAQAHSALAEAWSDLGYESKAAEEAKKAFDLSPKLSAEARGLITGRYSEMMHDWPKAIENYARLRTLFVDDPEYGMLLARSQTSAGKGQAALATLDQTQQKNAAKGMAARLDLLRSEAQESLGDYHQQLASASAASEKAKSLQSNLLLARSRIQECSALLNLGDPQKARPLCEEARQLNLDAGDQLGAARAINVVANAAWQQGNSVEAKKLYEQALDISQMIGDKIDEAGALNNLANILDDQGDHAAAIKTYQKSILVAEERDDKAGKALAQQNLGVVFFENGNAKAGGEMLQAAIKVSHEVGDKSTEATVLNNLCLLSLEAGELKKAKGNCEDSFRLRTEMDSKPDLAKALVSRGSLRMAEGNLAGGRKDYEDALQIQEPLGQKTDVAYTQIALGRLALTEKRYDNAQKLAIDAATELAAEKDTSGEADARSLLALAQAGLKNTAAAEAEIATARKLIEQSTDKKTKFRVELTGALVDLEAGKNDQASAALQKLEKDLSNSGLVALGLEAKLALGRAELHSGKSAPAKILLAELSRDARAKGFMLISEEAAKTD
jgi:eukaryotic-like serine/threonine-protein kinase